MVARQLHLHIFIFLYKLSHLDAAILPLPLLSFQMTAAFPTILFCPQIMGKGTAVDGNDAPGHAIVEAPPRSKIGFTKAEEHFKKSKSADVGKRKRDEPTKEEKENDEMVSSSSSHHDNDRNPRTYGHGHIKKSKSVRTSKEQVTSNETSMGTTRPTTSTRRLSTSKATANTFTVSCEVIWDF